MLQSAHQFAVSYPFTRCHDSLVVKKKSSSSHANEGRRSGKENRKHCCRTCSPFATRFLPPPIDRTWSECFWEQFWRPTWQEMGMFSSTQLLLFFTDSSAATNRATTVVLVANMTLCVRSMAIKGKCLSPSPIFLICLIFGLTNQCLEEKVKAEMVAV